MLYLGKPLSLYNLSCQQLQVGDGPEDISSDITLSFGQSDSVCGPDSPGVVHTQGDATHSVSAASGSNPNHAFLVDPVLSFVKAFRLRGDKDSLKKLVCERFSDELALWEVCGSAFEA